MEEPLTVQRQHKTMFMKLDKNYDLSKEPSKSPFFLKNKFYMLYM